jgi:hypothetical protein
MMPVGVFLKLGKFPLEMQGSVGKSEIPAS